jgi:hypothetical protein
MPSDAYEAAVVEIAGEGVRLDPLVGGSVPDEPNDVNLLAIAVALALGRAGYEHHPDARDPERQTLEALLAGETTMPWWRRSGTAPADRTVRCERATASASWVCEVHERS